MCVPIFLICLGFSLTSFSAQAADARSGQITHVMLFWLKRPGNVNHRNFLLRGCRTLLRFRGVNDARVREAFEKFEHDPRRGGALDAMLQSLVRRYALHNFANE